MKEWLEENPNGSKDAFEQYFKALSASVRKVSSCSYSPFPVALTLFCVQTYKDRASAAVGILLLYLTNKTDNRQQQKAARKGMGKRKGAGREGGGERAENGEEMER